MLLWQLFCVSVVSASELPPNHSRVGPVVHPHKIGVDQRPGSLLCSGRQGLGAREVRVELWPDGMRSLAADGADRLGVLNDPAGHVGGGPEGPLKRLAVVRPDRGHDAGKRHRITLDQPEALPPNPPELGASGGGAHEFPREGCRQGCGQRSDAASSNARPAAGHLLDKPLHGSIVCEMFHRFNLQPVAGDGPRAAGHYPSWSVCILPTDQISYDVLKTTDHQRQTVVAHLVRGVLMGVVVRVAVEGGVSDHHRGVAVPPERPLV